MISKDELKDICRGEWVRIIAEIGRIAPGLLDGKKHACPKCGGNTRFRMVDPDDGAVICSHCFQVNNGDGFAAIMWLTDCTFPEAIRKVSELVQPPTQPAKAVVINQDDRAFRNRVYSKFATIFPLSDAHRQQLKQRGLTDIEIERRGYWSAPPSNVMALVKNFSIQEERQEIGRRVPGIFHNGGLVIAARDSLVIPVRDSDGMVVALQQRPNQVEKDTPKYRWVSFKDGVSSGAPCHVPLVAPTAKMKPGVLRLTEGPLKADIATCLSSVLTIAVAGVSVWKSALSEIERINPNCVWLAFDTDSATKPEVAKAAVDVYDHLSSQGLTVHFESWGSEHKGIDDALKAGAEIEVLNPKDTRERIEQLRLVVGNSGVATRLRNFKLVPSKSDNPERSYDKEPLPVPEIAANLVKMQQGWPKSCKGVLFIQQPDQSIRELKQSADLFGWIAARMPVDFTNHGGCIGKQEFFAELPYHVEQFDATEEYPHFPPIKNHYYAKQFQPGDGSKLEEFLDFFSPATRYDRQLILAFVATTFWGGAPGRRVAFGIDALHGTGSGKSELVKRIADLTNGSYDIDAKKIDESELRKKLVNGETQRVVLLDNIKESCLSSAVIESLITSNWIGGHKLNHGYIKRPNTITWAMTMNGLSLSRDLAQRTVVIKLDKPKKKGAGDWSERFDQFMLAHRGDVISDIAAFFRREPVELDHFTRWASWERAVLARCDSPHELQKVIENRSKESDEDMSTALSIREFFTEKLLTYGYRPDEDKVHIPSDIAAHWLARATGREFNQRSSRALIKSLIDGGSINNFRENPSRKFGRGWLWNCDTEGHVNYSLQEKIDPQRSDERLF